MGHVALSRPANLMILSKKAWLLDLVNLVFADVGST